MSQVHFTKNSEESLCLTTMKKFFRSSIASSSVFRPVICARVTTVPIGYARARLHNLYSCGVLSATRWTNSAVEHSREPKLISNMGLRFTRSTTPRGSHLSSQPCPDLLKNLDSAVEGEARSKVQAFRSERNGPVRVILPRKISWLYRSFAPPFPRSPHVNDEAVSAALSVTELPKAASANPKDFITIVFFRNWKAPDS